MTDRIIGQLYAPHWGNPMLHIAGLNDCYRRVEPL